jgi:hypothetical protein
MWCDYILIPNSEFLHQQMNMRHGEEMIITNDLKNEFNVYQIVNGIIEYAGNTVFKEPVNKVEINRALEPVEMIKVVVLDINQQVQRVYRLKLKNRVVTGITELQQISTNRA